MEEDSTWLLALEAALHDGADDREIISITRGRPLPEEHRAQIWSCCLGGSRVSNFSHFDEIFDLQEQSVVREDCRVLVDKLGNEEDDKISVISDVESVFTHYCKTRHLRYDPTRLWADILLPLLACKMSREQIYVCFEQIIEKFIPRETNEGAPVYHLLRLLLLYHDPELSTFLDSRKIIPEAYAKSWLRSLFSNVCSLDAVCALWDIYFQERDPFFVLFLSLVVVVNARDQILGLKGEDKETIIKTLSQAPAALSVEDAGDFCSLARYYIIRTPNTFRQDFNTVIFGCVYLGAASSEARVGDLPLSQALCLPVSAEEILLSFDEPDEEDQVQFFLIDCRPAEQYNAGHLPNAFHLDAGLMLQQPASFQTAVQGLFLAQRQALSTNTPGCGHHLCLLGSGEVQEDQYVHMVCASFLQRNTALVSLAKGGYQALHDQLSNNLAESLSEHNPQECLACPKLSPSVSQGSTSASTSLSTTTTTTSQTPSQASLVNRFSALSSVFKIMSAEMKEKFVEYITNPNGEDEANQRHVSSLDKGKLYRNQGDVFSIDYEEGKEEEEIICLDDIETVAMFSCHHLSENGSMQKCQLILTPSNLLEVKDIKKEKGKMHGRISARRPLSMIVKITSKKKKPELITFKFGHTTADGQAEITDMDRFFIPNAGEATKQIKEQIVKQMEASLP